MIGATEGGDTFYDCHSDEEEDVEEQEMAHGDAVVCKQAPRFDDPVQIRAVLERAATATQQLLRCYGGTDIQATRPLMTRFYPATLELSARLHTDDLCPCPKERQCKLRGDPVTLNLPIELNPESGQVKVNLFQPKSMGTICGCNAPVDKRKRRSNNRSVRWSAKDETCCSCFNNRF